ncbi:CNP1-like family protein [Aquitalea sp. USM4]|uniref:CNP1-like family protein n=1 Tax=unclassified Aquitalea TaxID=2628611 RepID=UPI0013F14F25|nr:CNP1-like family protein [Aquitalea sp. USM4]
MNLSRFGLALAGLLLALAAQASEYNKGFNNTNYALEDVKPWEEGKYSIPAYPAAPDWIGFYVGPEVANKYFADSKSMTVGEDGVVRLILRVQSPAGAENLSVEGIQCSANTYRSYAFGDSINKRWIESMREEWRKIEYDDKARRALREDLCVEKTAPKSAEQAVKLLRAAPWR